MTEHKPRELTLAHGVLQAGEALSPSGKPLTLADLPRPGTKRWVARRKAEVVAAVRGGLITLQEACLRYRLSVDEFRSWERLLEAHGVAGLKITQTRRYRPAPRNG
ncbi:MAG: DUF1153 domain-containing protein [Rhodospirillales bacterium]|jgi:hypothetical protein